MESRTVQPILHSLHAAVTPPGSKSITNRAFILAALARGETRLSGVLHSDDTQYMSAALKSLGVEIEQDLVNCSARIVGCAGRFPSSRSDLFLGNSGTSIRFLTAALVHGEGTFRLDGIERMRQRPIGDLVDSLRQWGVQIRYEQNDGFPPLEIRSEGLTGSQTSIRGNVSSQFLSALMMASVGTKQTSRITVLGELVSRPYVDMTRAMMEAFGARLSMRSTDFQQNPAPVPENGFAPDKTPDKTPDNTPDNTPDTTPDNTPTFEILVDGGQEYRGIDYQIEPDASAASYFFASAAVVGGQICVQGLSRNALQGDVRFVDCLEQMGCVVEWRPNEIVVQRFGALHGIDVDMHHISDTAQTLGVVALFADSPTTIRNVANMRLKETDRIAALCAELRKFGARVIERPDGLTVFPLPKDQYQVPSVATYDDHRMAMSFAIAGLAIPGVRIENPACTAKTFPRFFEELAKLG